MISPNLALFALATLGFLWALLFVRRTSEPFCKDCGRHRWRRQDLQGRWSWICYRCDPPPPEVMEQIKSRPSARYGRK